MNTKDSTPQSDPDDDGVDVAADDTADADDRDADDRVMGLLSEHVPLSLIVDLSAPEGPDSQEILTEEGEPEDVWWDEVGDGSVDEDDVTRGDEENSTA